MRFIDLGRNLLKNYSMPATLAIRPGDFNNTER